jgi:hypothetical protein
MYCRGVNLISTDVLEVRYSSNNAQLMVGARTSETSVDIQLRTRQYIPEDSELKVDITFSDEAWICEISGSYGGEYEIRVFWDAAPCSHVKLADVSEVRTASITWSP